jgi:hypothetical protein
VETEKVAENSKSRCAEQDIPFYRFNPDLKEIIPAGETDTTKLLDMVIEAKIQTKEQGLKEMTELLQMLTINVRSDASTTCTPSNSAAPLSTKDSSYAERSSSPPPPAPAEQYHQQVPRFMITSESGEEESEEVRPNINDNYNEQLNKSMVSPAEAIASHAGGDDNGSVANSGIDFLESESAKDELDSGESFCKHYQLKVDSHK